MLFLYLLFETRSIFYFFFFFQAEDGIRDYKVTGVQTCALPIFAYAGKGIVDSVVARSTALALRWVLIELAIVGTQALVQRGLGLTRSLLGARQIGRASCRERV